MQKLFGVSITLEPGHAEPRRHGPRRRVLRQRRQRRAGRVDRPDRAVLPEELAHAVHRRHHQPADGPDQGRAEPGQDGAGAARDRDLDPGADSRPAVAAAVTSRTSAASTNNSAADYATYYWVTDLRTVGRQRKNNVPGSDRDPATWQHLNFAALSLGTEGKLPPATSRTPRNRSPPARSSGRSRSRPSTSPTSRGSTTSGTPRSTAAAASSTRSRRTSCAPAWARSWTTSRTRPARGPAPRFDSVNLSGTEQLRLPRRLRAGLGRAA